MTNDQMRGTKTADLFWGPFAELRSGQRGSAGQSRPYEQVKATVLDALSARMASANMPTLLALAEKAKGPILLLGCGAGPLNLSLAENGSDVVCLDQSADVIEALRHRLASLPPDARGRVKLAQAELGEFEAGATFPLIVVPFFKFALLDGDRERQELLSRIERYLSPNGVMAFDYPVYKPEPIGTGTLVNMDLLVDGKTVAGEIGWKLSEGSTHLIVNSSSRMAQEGGTTRHYLDAIQIELASFKKVEDLLSGAGLVVVERHPSTSDGMDSCLLRCRRRADISYPLWHPFLPMNGLEEHVTILVEGKGCKVRDKNGKEYIDANAGLWNTYSGLGEPEIIQAITDQLHRLSYGTLFGWRGNEPALELARELVQMAPSPLQWAYLTGSGSESVELSIKIARLYSALRRRVSREIVYLDDSYHGTFFGSMSLSGLAMMQEIVGPLLPGVSSIPTPNPLRCPSNLSYVDFAVSCADALGERAASGEVAAFIVEPILGSAGVVIPPPEYFRRIEQICREHQILLIFDEVATGLGRTGRWFAAEHYNIRPDILLLSKGLNSGYLPLGAVLFSAEIGESLIKQGVNLFHGSTSNGHPACCAAALANIRLMRRKGLMEQADASGAYFRDRLNELRTLASVKEIRAIGLMLALVLIQEDGAPATPRQILQLFIKLREMGVLSYAAFSSLVFAPAFVITREEIDAIVGSLQSILSEVRLRNGIMEPA
ncbi:MAG TPA: aminotransferase class III-fold pyridoxal phosphate-dependent enzyme [Blastocatellia bacterium]|nr:aminotransferase class III-fold pyridoxal phosphate-dependent enzyme [Blastocatellia bacterium]